MLGKTYHFEKKSMKRKTFLCFYNLKIYSENIEFLTFWRAPVCTTEIGGSKKLNIPSVTTGAS